MSDFLSDFLWAMVVTVILTKLLSLSRPELVNVEDYEPIIYEPIIYKPIIKEPIIKEPIIEERIIEECVIEEPKTIIINKLTLQDKLVGHNVNVKHTDFSFWLGQDKTTILILCVCSLAMLFLHIYVTYNHSNPYPTGRLVAQLFLKNNKYNKTPSFVIKIMEKIKKSIKTIGKWKKK